MKISMKKMERWDEGEAGAVEGGEVEANITTIIVAEAIWLAPHHLAILSILIENRLFLTNNLPVLGCQMVPGVSHSVEGN